MSTTKTKRVGPACTPETAPHGCGRPLPVANVPKADDAIAKLKARVERDTLRLAVAQGQKTVTVTTLSDEEKAEAEAAKAAKA